MPDKREKRITLLVSYVHPYKAGSGINALNFGKYLTSKGYSVRILSFNRNLKYEAKTKLYGITIDRIPYFNNCLLLKILSLFIILPRLFFSLLRTSYVIIYGGFIIGWEFYAIVGWLLNKRIIFRSTMFNEDDPVTLIRKSKFLSPLRRLALKLSDQYFSLTPAFSDSYRIVFGPSNSRIVQTTQGVGVDYKSIVTSEEKTIIRKNLGLNPEDFIILSIGIVINRKGYRKVFEKLNEIKFPFTYIILGDFTFENNPHITQEEKRNRDIYNTGIQTLGTKVIFKGYVENVKEYLSAADVFLMPAFKEGLPNSLLEAMASGIPSVVRNINQIENYLISHGHNGLLFQQEKEIPGMIEKLYANPEYRATLGQNAFNTINEKHSFEHVYTRLQLD